MALRLSRLFGNSAEFWLNAQRAADLWDATQAIKRKWPGSSHFVSHFGSGTDGRGTGRGALRASRARSAGIAAPATRQVLLDRLCLIERCVTPHHLPRTLQRVDLLVADDPLTGAHRRGAQRYCGPERTSSSMQGVGRASIDRSPIVRSEAKSASHLVQEGCRPYSWAFVTGCVVETEVAFLQAG